MTANLPRYPVRPYIIGMPDNPTDTWFPPADGGPADPIKAVQAAMRTPAPKRFYRHAETAERNGGFALLLDGRPARTPARRELLVPTRALGEALAAEWDAQGAEIDPATMPLTRLANSAIDGVADTREAVIEDLVRYAGSDLLCYRADEPERLAAAQAAAWDPLILWARDALGARFNLAEGLMHVAQPPEASAAVRRALDAEPSPFRLAALHAMTTLTGSVLLALAHVADALDAGTAWAAAHVDERHQESLWGEDEEALERRARREAEFRAASDLYRLSGG